MARIIRRFLVAALAAMPSVAAAWPSPHTIGPFAYVSPAPGSALHNAQTNIIVRPGPLLDPASLHEGTIQVAGASSGSHPGVLRLSDDARTVLFRPSTPFAPGEQVTCVVAPGIRTESGGELDGAQFDFTIGPPSVPVSALTALGEEFGAAAPRFAVARAGSLRTDSIPDDLPPRSLIVSGTPENGLLFLCDIRFEDGTYRSHLMALRDDGTPVFARLLPGPGFDFKVQANGSATYFDGAKSRYYAMNGNFAVRDSFACGNGYTTDIHEFQLLPDGHALLAAYDSRTLDLSGIVPGGNAQAEVVGLVVQELDRAKDVVFEWRSWDHFQITDCVSRPLTGSRVDYVHGNSIERDDDGNLLISSRHLDEITKISRSTGEVLWRFGGSHNEFTFSNDPERFSHQHSARRLPNGHLLLFDNGNYHVPAHSRAVEYALDEDAKVATRVWEYRNAPDVFSSAMGSVQRLSNGNTVIGWGATNPTITEVTPGGAKVLELALPPSVYSYRAFRHEWPPVLPAAIALRSGTSIHAPRGGHVVVSVTGSGFAPDSLDPATVRLSGVAPDGLTPPASGGAAEFQFPVDLLLAAQRPGARTLDFAGSLVSGERIRGSVNVTIEGTRAVAGRMVSPVGSFPIRIALRSDGVSARRVLLGAFDVRGRRVAYLSKDVDASGILAWDGRRRDGTPLASGIYFIRTEGSALTETAKVVLAR